MMNNGKNDQDDTDASNIQEAFEQYTERIVEHKNPTFKMSMQK